MTIAQILQNLFEIYPSPTCTRHFDELTFEEHIKEFKSWLHRNLLEIEQKGKAVRVSSEGRLGVATVVLAWNRDDTNNAAKISKDNLTIQSKSAFCTVKANSCVYKGKWMYEVQLRSKGVMQIGWCSSKCQFTRDTGVGDTENSYGFDGSKQRLWHVHTRKYGPYWRSGDVFGVCLDMDHGQIEYYRNGVSLGTAFNDVRRGPGIALFPAMSLAFDESVTVNLGGSPFRHPIDSYKPLQAHPNIKLQQAEFLLNHLVNVARVISTTRPQRTKSNKDASAEATYVILSALLLNELSSILCDSYVIEEKIFRTMKSMCIIRTNIDTNNIIHPGMPESTLGTFLSLFWANLPDETMKSFLKKFVAFLSSMYRETPIDLDYEKQRISIVVLTCICNHPPTRRYLLEHRFFHKNILPIFLYIKPPDEQTLAQLIPDDIVWTNAMSTSKKSYDDRCLQLIACTDTLYTLQKRLVEKLLNNADGTERLPSSRMVFISKLRRYVLECSIENRAFDLMDRRHPTATQPAVALSLLCILLDILKTNFMMECPDGGIFVPPKAFYDGSLQYFRFDRIGGILSHLKRLYRDDLVQQLGPNVEPTSNESDELFRDTMELSDIYSAMFLLGNHPRSSGSAFGSTRQPDDLLDTLNALSSGEQPPTIPTAFDIQTKPGNMNSRESLTYLLDSCILYYYAVAHKYTIMIADLRDNIETMSGFLIETNATYENLVTMMEMVSSDSDLNSAHGNVLKELHEKLVERKRVFVKRSTEMARKQAWYRSVALGKHRRDLLCWMLNAVVRTLSNSANEGNLFTFVPEFYVNITPILLDTIMDFSFHDMKAQNDLSDCAYVIKAAAEFLSSQINNSKIVLAACRDSLLQALGTLMCHESGIKALENCSKEHQKSLMDLLLRPYLGRAWGQSNWLLLRFWLGDGFAYRDPRSPCIWQDSSNQPLLGLIRNRAKNGSHTGLLRMIAPPSPSAHFQKLIGEMLTADEPFSTELINSILSQLNWAFSEFVLILQEIQNAAQRQETQGHDSRQTRICAMCFELTVSLMRALEMLISVAPSLFIDTSGPNSATLLSRVCQLVSQVLSRVSIPPGCFQFVIDLCLPEMNGVTHFGIISASLGILIALLKTDLESDNEDMLNMSKVAKILLTDPSFQIACLEFAVGDVKTPIQAQQDIPRGNFDAQNRLHIDPQNRHGNIRLRTEQPIIKFSLLDYSTHVSADEIDKVKRLIKFLLTRKSLLSDITIPSDDIICTICYANSMSATFQPCNHQSCVSCIKQHLMNTKVCFYCKSFITKVYDFDGVLVYESGPIVVSQPLDY